MRRPGSLASVLLRSQTCLEPSSTRVPGQQAAHPNVSASSTFTLKKPSTPSNTDVLLCPPRDDRSAGYYGIARFTQLDPDLSDPNFMLARLEEFLPFQRPVPLLHAGIPFEEAAQGDNGSLLWWVYAQGIRFVTDQTFANILAAASPFGDRGLEERAEADYVVPPSLSDQLSTRELESTKRRKRDARLRMLVLPL